VWRDDRTCSFEPVRVVSSAHPYLVLCFRLSPSLFAFGFNSIKNEGFAKRFLTYEILGELGERKKDAMAALKLIEEDRGDAFLSMNPGMWMGNRELVSEMAKTLAYEPKIRNPTPTPTPTPTPPSSPTQQKQTKPGQQSTQSPRRVTRIHGNWEHRLKSSLESWRESQPSQCA
jgi:hypothetical protein